MANIVKLKTTDGTPVEFTDSVIGSGAMKDVYFSPDRSYVVAFFRNKLDFNAKERVQMIVGKYRENIFEQAGGDFWKNYFCWPTKMLEHQGLTGIVAPTYPKEYFFEYGSVNNDSLLGIRGKEKNGKWFITPKHRKKFLDPRELGNWWNYFRLCLNVSRAARRMHAAGLAHSDLSCNNILVNPIAGSTIIIDIDGLVVPGKYPPEVIGTPGFIAPEVIATKHLPKQDPNRALPSIHTDRHALAVMIYQYLLYRHPLEGSKIHDPEPTKDMELAMGSKALFIEHPTDASNRPKQFQPTALPWADPAKIPCDVTGPYLKKLFHQAFIEGLHNPRQRPSADDWETALVKTLDLMQPCANPSCEQKWYVFDNTTQPRCPFCGAAHKGQLPVLNIYSARQGSAFRPDDHRLMVYHNQYIYAWHLNRNVFPNEKITPAQQSPVGYFSFHQGRWVLVNQNIPHLADVSEAGNPKPVPIGQALPIVDNQQILLSKEDGGRLIHVQMVG